MAVSTRTTVRMNPEQLRKKVAAGSFRSLGHASAAVRLTARRSIRRRKKASTPGTPPHTQSGNLKRSIRYEVTQDDAVIGPVNEFGGRIWNLHEHGGMGRPRRQLKVHRFKPGEFGPVRVRRRGSNPTQATSFHRARLRTMSQAARATRLIEEENQRRMGGPGPRRYPKRPFMGPALEQMRPRLPKFWRNSVR